MSYDYQTERKYVFTEDGQVDFLAVRDRAKSLLSSSGAVKAGKLFVSGLKSPNSWATMACVDRLVELGELRQVSDPSRGAWQDRVFVDPRDDFV